MKKNMKMVCLALMSLIFLTACEDRSDLTSPAEANTGTVDFSSFVTIGNSLTSGYQNGSLYQSAQQYSFGNLIAGQTGADFVQPLVDNPGTAGRMEIASLVPLVIKTNINSGMPLNSLHEKAYNNLGVPGALLYDVLNATGSENCASGLAGAANPLFDMILRGNGSQFEQAKSLNPSFITLWIGNNDILGHATSGGTLPFTPEINFEGLYAQLADSIATLGAKVVVANIPAITSIPFFTTLPAVLPDGAGGMITLYGQTGADGSVRALVPGQDLLTLKAKSVLFGEDGQPTMVGFSPDNPLPNGVVLDGAEVGNIAAVIASYNNTIESIAAAKNFALVDMNHFLEGIVVDGHLENGITFTSDYISGGLFSLDGVHCTTRGYGVVANEFIKVINESFEAEIPLLNVSTLPGSLPLEI